jgi:hypothetical protein
MPLLKLLLFRSILQRVKPPLGKLAKETASTSGSKPSAELPDQVIDGIDLMDNFNSTYLTDGACLKAILFTMPNCRYVGSARKENQQ